MALRIGGPRRKPSAEDLVARVALAVTDLRPGLEVTSGLRPSPWIGWHLGPAITSVQSAVGEVSGWSWAAVAPALDPAEPPAGRDTLWIRRSFSERALATAVVRFYGMHSRYFSTAEERYRADIAAICDVDDPERSGYPIVDAVVDLLLERPDPSPGPATGNVLDDLAAKMRRLGYENLWAVAYSRVP